jgi:hypothetical protein
MPLNFGWNAVSVKIWSILKVGICKEGLAIRK